MVNFYIKKILESDGEFTVNNVPRLWKQKVINKLVTDGYVVNEDGTVSME